MALIDQRTAKQKPVALLDPNYPKWMYQEKTGACQKIMSPGAEAALVERDPTWVNHFVPQPAQIPVLTNAQVIEIALEEQAAKFDESWQKLGAEKTALQENLRAVEADRDTLKEELDGLQKRYDFLLKQIEAERTAKKDSRQNPPAAKA
jgi:hypothetical protein